MLKVVDGKIHMTKGDNEVLPVNLSMHDQAYEMGENDRLILTVRELPNKNSPLLFRAESNPGSDEIIIPAEATAEMKPGYYSADIEFVGSNGEPTTLWPDCTEVKPDENKSFKNFILTPEVT